MLHINNQKIRIKSKRFDSAEDVKYVVDRLHIMGHTQSWCKDKCHPDLFPDLKNVNTMVCEQINFWLGRYKHILKHMNHSRFNFFLYIILNKYNELKCEGIYNSTAQIDTSKKRKRSE